MKTWADLEQCAKANPLIRRLVTAVKNGGNKETELITTVLIMASDIERLLKANRSRE